MIVSSPTRVILARVMRQLEDRFDYAALTPGVMVSTAGLFQVIQRRRSYTYDQVLGVG